MAKNTENATITISEAELQTMIANAVAAALASQKAPEKKAAKSTKKVDFVKKDGTVVKVSKQQAAAWEAYRSKVPAKKEAFERMKAEFEEARNSFKASKALKDALKKNPSMTRKEAKELGFVGTKDDLKILKAELKLR